jgi:hypothetical protein
MSTEKTDSKAVEFIYQEREIHFSLGNDGDVMINATEMAKAFGKRTDHYLQNEATKKFIEAIKVPDISGTLETNVVENRGRNGIYFCEILALDFATWLDVDFKVWIYRRIQDVLFGKAKNVTSKISEAEKKKLEISILTEKVKKLGNEDVNKLLLEIDELKKIENEKKKAVRQFSSQYKMF